MTINRLRLRSRSTGRTLPRAKGRAGNFCRSEVMTLVGERKLAPLGREIAKPEGWQDFPLAFSSSPCRFFPGSLRQEATESRSRCRAGNFAKAACIRTCLSQSAISQPEGPKRCDLPRQKENAPIATHPHFRSPHLLPLLKTKHRVKLRSLPHSRRLQRRLQLRLSLLPSHQPFHRLSTDLRLAVPTSTRCLTK
jgi:hypothetical protein